MINKKGYDIMSDIETHLGKKVEDRRLRFHIIQNFQRLIDKNNGIENCLAQLIALEHPVVIDAAKYRVVKKRDVKL